MDHILASGARHYSPIWIFQTKPLKTGRGLLELEFWHANYPEGVQQKTARVRVLSSCEGALVAEVVGATGTASRALLLVTEITAEWVRLHFPSESNIPNESDPLQDWLDRNIRHG